MSPQQNSEIHSDEVEEIIGQSPSWIIRWGNFIIGLIVIGIVFATAILKYPDVVSAPVSITATEPPIKVFSQSSGRMQNFFFNDGDLVEADKIIAVIDNSAITKDVFELKNILFTIDTSTDLKRTISSIHIPETLQVGQIQTDFSALYQSINNYYFHLKNAYYAKSLNVINKQEQNNSDIDKAIREKEKLLNEELKAEAWKDSANKILLAQKVISKAEYNEIRKGYTHQHLGNADNENILLQNKKIKTDLQKNKEDVIQQYNLKENDLILSIRIATQKVRSQIEVWEKQYVLKSPYAGKLVFFTVRKQNQYITAGTPVFIITPKTQKYELRVQLPLYKAGKVKLGQDVIIKLRQYPYEEYGMLKARITKISDVYIDSAYIVELELLNGMTTTRNHKIELQPELTGTAEIITHDITILNRILNNTYGKMHSSM